MANPLILGFDKILCLQDVRQIVQTLDLRTSSSKGYGNKSFNEESSDHRIGRNP